MGRKRKSRTLTGQRIPEEIKLRAIAFKQKKKISLQDSYRELDKILAQEFKKRK